MNRRKFIVSAGAAASLPIAGCSALGSGGDSGGDVNGSDDGPGSGEENGTAPGGSGDGSGDTSDEEIPNVSRSGKIEFNFSQMMVKEYLRYYDEDVDAVSQLQPDRDLFIETSYILRNLGGEPWAPPEADSFELVGTDGEAEYLPSLPNGVEWEQVRLRDEYRAYWITPDSLNLDRIEAGEELIVYSLYDAALSDGYWIEAEIEGELIRSGPEHIFAPDSLA